MISFSKYQICDGKDSEIKLGLDRINKILSLFNNPQDSLNNIIHVAGTNGKGSVIAYLRSFLESSNYTVNIYTSPHLVSFNERIRINGQLISDSQLDFYADKCNKIAKQTNIKLTFFEFTTLISILAFSDNNAQYNIFETGLGGRLDATNVFSRKLASIITPISYDHQEYLGNKISDIATEKLEITKSSEISVIAKQKDEVNNLIANQYNKKNLYLYEQYKGDILLPSDFGFYGEHQIDNFIVAAKTYRLLTHKNYPEDFIKKLYWPARLQKLDNNKIGSLKLDSNWELWLDGGHNVQAAEMIKTWINKNKIDHVIISMVERKDYVNFMTIISSTEANIYFVEMKDEQGLTIDQIIDKNIRFKEIYKNYKEAVRFITKENKAGKILFCGSLFFAGEILSDTISVP